MSILAFLRDNAPWLSAGVLLTFLSGFGQTYFISIFAGEIRESFALSHGQWGGIYTLGTTASALVMVWAGGLTDRFRVRALAPVILVMMTGACVFMALNPVWWLLPVVIFSLRFTGQGMMSHIAVVAMARWFVAARGKALSVATLGFAIGEAFLPLIFVSLLLVYDWRMLWILAAVVAILGIPLLMLLLRRERTPQSWAQTSQSLGMEERHWTRRQTLGHFLFWFMVPALLGPSAFNTAFFFHQVHFAEIKAISHVELVAMFPIYTGVGIGAMILSGWALDRLGTARLLPFMQIPMVAAFVLFAFANGPGMVLLGFVFLALTTGANSTL
ncbi:MFS transporter, partial [uncultured Roseovarius sp.]